MRRQGPTAASFFDDMELKPLKPVPMQSQHSSSSFFESIADAIRTHDKPLVHIEDAEDGSAVRHLLSATHLPVAHQSNPLDSLALHFRSVSR